MISRTMSSFKLIAVLSVLALLPACSISFGGGSSSQMEKEVRSLRAEVSRLRAELDEGDGGQASQPEDNALAHLYQERADLGIALATLTEDSNAAKVRRKELRNHLDAIDQEIERLQAVDQ